MEDDYNNATTALAKREEVIANLTKENDKNKAVLSLLKSRHPQTYNSLADEKGAAAFLQAVVAAVRLNPEGKQDLVMLTIGKDAKIEEGIEFIIFRGNSYVCRVRAEKVLNDMVACRVVGDSWNTNNLQIQQGDLAQNRL